MKQHERWRRHRHHHRQPSEVAREWAAPAVLVLLVVGGYLGTLTGPFVLDDHRLITGNSAVRDFSAAQKYFREPVVREEDGAATYRPLMMLSFALDYQLWGLNPVGFRQINVILHTACVLMGYWLARRVVLPFFEGRGNGVALAAAAVFAAHPVAGSCVSYVSQRGRLLAATAIMGTMCLFALGRELRRETAGLASAAAVLVFAVGLWSAETAMVTPVLLVVYLLATDQADDWRAWAWLGVMVAVEIAYLAVRHWALAGWGWPEPSPGVGALGHIGWFVGAVGMSMKMLVLPGAVELQWRLADVTAGRWVVLALAALASTAAALFVLWRGRRAIPTVWFGAAWSGAILIPMWSVAATNGVVGEQWLYLPGFGVYLAVCAAAYQRLQRGGRVRLTSRQAVVATAALVAVLMTITIAQNSTWRSESRLLARMVAVSPKSPALRFRYGRALGQEGLDKHAMEQYRAVLELDPNHVEAHTALAIALGEAGKLDEAIQHFEQAVRVQPGNPQLHFNLAVAYARNRDYTRAIAHYRWVVRAAPGVVDAANNLAWILATCPVAELRNGAEAVELAKRAVQLAGEDDVDLLDTLAAAHAEAGQFAEAVNVAQKAAQLAGVRGQSDRVAEIRSRTKLYLAGQPYRAER